MTNSPMWDDQTADSNRLRGPLEREEIFALETGAAVRVVTKGSRLVTEGVLDGVRVSYNKNDRFTIQGREFSVYNGHDVYSVAADDVRPQKDEPIELSDEAVLETIADLQTRDNIDGRPSAVSRSLIVDTVLGFSPSSHMPAADFGGRSKETYVNQFLRVGKLKASIARLIEEGAIVDVTAPAAFSRNASRESRAVRFGYGNKSGYVTTSAMEAALEALDAKHRAAILQQFEASAIAIIAERHRDEVDIEIARLVADAAL